MDKTEVVNTQTPTPDPDVKVWENSSIHTSVEDAKKAKEEALENPKILEAKIRLRSGGNPKSSRGDRFQVKIWRGETRKAPPRNPDKKKGNKKPKKGEEYSLTL